MMLTTTQGGANLCLPLPHEAVGIEAPHVGQKRPLSTVVFLCPSKIINAGLIRVKSFMVGCIEQPLIGLAVSMCGSFNLIQPTAQRLKPISGGLLSNIGHKPMLNHTQKPLNNSVSEKPSINHLALIEASTAIGSIAESNAQFTKGFACYLDSLNKHLSEISVYELINLLNQYRNDFNGRTDSTPEGIESFYPEQASTPPAPPKTSRFNILNKAKQVIAERVTFDQAKQYQDCTVKFAGMEVVL